MKRFLIVVVVLLADVLPSVAGPPGDLKAYCVSKWPQSHEMQRVCMNQEEQARTSVSDWAAADPETYARCRQTSSSWEMLESCGKQRDQPAGASPPVSASPPTSPPPPAGVESRPILSTDADRHLKDVLERSGATDAKCTKKQYGTGWIAVCE